MGKREKCVIKMAIDAQHQGLGSSYEIQDIQASQANLVFGQLGIEIQTRTRSAGKNMTYYCVKTRPVKAVDLELALKSVIASVIEIIDGEQAEAV